MLMSRRLGLRSVRGEIGGTVEGVTGSRLSVDVCAGPRVEVQLGPRPSGCLRFEFRNCEETGSPRLPQSLPAMADWTTSPMVLGGEVRRGGSGPFHNRFHGGAAGLTGGEPGVVFETDRVAAGLIMAAGLNVAAVGIGGVGRQVVASGTARGAAERARDSASPRSSQSDSDSDSQNFPEPSQRLEGQVPSSLKESAIIFLPTS